MQIFFERSGGFMGLQIQAAVDTVDLPVEEAEEWEQALAEAGFFDLPSHLEAECGADSLIYKMTVVTAEQEHTALCTDENAPEQLRPLLRKLTILARH